MRKTLFAILIFFPMILSAQSDLKGIIYDKTKLPLDDVNVKLTQRGKLVYSTITNHGRFLIKDLITGKYLLTASILGYDSINVEVKAPSELIEIYMHANSIELNNVTINSKLSLIERKIDKVIYNIENMPTMAGADALEAITKLPSVKLLNNNTLSLVGKGGVNIMINDKITLLSGEDLLNYLRSIPADNISKIEIIANPSAKYDAQGNSGLINIVYKKNRPETWTIGLRSSYTQRTYDRETIGSSFDYQKNKLGIYSSLDYGYGSKQNLYQSKYFYPNQTWINSAPSRYYTNGSSIRAGIDYKFSKNWVTGIQFLGNYYNSPSSANRQQNVVSNESSLRTNILTPSIGTSKSNSNGLNFYNKVTFDSTGKLLILNIDYFNYNSRNDNNFSTTYIPQNGGIISGNFYSAENKGLQTAYNISTQLDSELPTKLINLSIGAKASFTKNDNNILLANTTSGNSVLDSSQSNQFIYSERTQALYISGNRKISKFETQIGLRLEATQTSGNSVTMLNLNRNSYVKIFPSIAFSYKIDSLNTLNLAYNRRINRPTYAYLNPFRWYSTSVAYTEGNPFLQPSFSNNIELNHTFQKSFNSKLYYSTVNNGYNQVTIVTPGSNIQIIRPENYIKSHSIGITETYTFDKIRWFSSNNTIDISRNWAKSTLLITNSKLSGTTVYLSSNNDFIINKNRSLIFSANLWLNTSGTYGLDKYSSASNLDLALKFLLFNKRLQLSFIGNDIFKSSITTLTSFSNNIKQDYRNYYDSRLFRLSISYKFLESKLSIKKRNFSNYDEQRRLGQ